jgi:hypothetical protein
LHDAGAFFLSNRDLGLPVPGREKNSRRQALLGPVQVHRRRDERLPHPRTRRARASIIRVGERWLQRRLKNDYPPVRVEMPVHAGLSSSLTHRALIASSNDRTAAIITTVPENMGLFSTPPFLTA